MLGAYHSGKRSKSGSNTVSFFQSWLVVAGVILTLPRTMLNAHHPHGPEQQDTFYIQTPGYKKVSFFSSDFNTGLLGRYNQEQVHLNQ